MDSFQKLTVDLLDGTMMEFRVKEYSVEDGLLQLMHFPEAGDVERVAINLRQLSAFSVKTWKL
jgi:hypothetical protein